MIYNGSGKDKFLFTMICSSSNLKVPASKNTKSMSMSCNNIPGPGHVFSNLFYCRIIHRLSTHLTLLYKYKYNYKYNFTGDILTRLTLL